jgi:hypothetical protein
MIMKMYLIKECGGYKHGDASYKIVQENKLKHVNNFGDFMRVYELKPSKPLSKQKLKSLGIAFIN